MVDILTTRDIFSGEPKALVWEVPEKKFLEASKWPDKSSPIPLTESEARQIAKRWLDKNKRGRDDLEIKDIWLAQMNPVDDYIFYPECWFYEVAFEEGVMDLSYLVDHPEDAYHIIILLDGTIVEPKVVKL
jgi:hypothetical protein